MWPWGHAAVGYLIYTVFLRAHDHGQPIGQMVIALGVGTQVPDLVDKTAAWYLHVLPTGRSFAHSLLTWGVVTVLIVGYVAHREGLRVDIPFSIGYLSHLFADALLPLVHAQWNYLSFLAWPIPAPPVYPREHGVVAHFARIQPTPFFLFEIGLTITAVAFWHRHGYPGLDVLRHRFRLQEVET